MHCREFLISEFHMEKKKSKKRQKKKKVLFHLHNRTYPELCKCLGVVKLVA